MLADQRVIQGNLSYLCGYRRTKNHNLSYKRNTGPLKKVYNLSGCRYSAPHGAILAIRYKSKCGVVGSW